MIIKHQLRQNQTLSPLSATMMMPMNNPERTTMAWPDSFKGDEVIQDRRSINVPYTNGGRADPVSDLGCRVVSDVISGEFATPIPLDLTDWDTNMSDTFIRHMGTPSTGQHSQDVGTPPQLPQPVQPSRVTSSDSIGSFYETVSVVSEHDTTCPQSPLQQQQQRQQIHERENDMTDFLSGLLNQVKEDVRPLDDFSTVFDDDPVPVGTKRTAAAAVPTTAPTTTTTSTKRDTTVVDSNPRPLKQRRQQTDDEIRAPRRRFRPYQEEQWVQLFEELTKYREEHGNCLVPHTYDKNPALSRWVKRQRYQYRLKKEGKMSTLTKIRLQKLQEVGFVWDSHAAAWEQRHNELAAYRRAHGHCNVPSQYPENPQLATWVKCQRRQCKIFRQGKKSNMTMERFTALDKLGFIWDLRDANTLFSRYD
eukprot:scaffold9762_cov83-Cylindrotheca_fusiformis.AAC.1